MPKRSSNSPAGKSVAAILMLTVLGAGVLAAYVGLNPKAAHVAAPPPAGPDFSIKQREDATGQKPTTGSGLTLLVPAVIENDIKLDKPAGDPPEGVAPEVHLVNKTLSSLQVDDGARALGIEVKDHLALVSFNPSIEKGYGTIEEGHLIKALRMALGQFPDIDKFQLLVEGKVVDSLGNIDLTAPVKVLRPGQKDPVDDGN